MRRTLLHAALLATLLGSAVGLVPAAAGAATPPAAPAAARGSTLLAGPGIRVTLPGAVSPGLVTALHVVLPAAAAALDGRLVVDHRAAQLIGIAVPRGATGLAPVAVPDGYAFGAYDLAAAHGAVSLDLVILPRRAGHLALSVAIDSLADRSGHALALPARSALGSLPVGSARRTLAAPAAAAAPRAMRPAAAQPTELLPDGRIDRRDLDLARAGWTQARQTGRICSAGSGLPGDADGDGCVDALDLQATAAAQGRRMASFSAPAIVRPRAAAGLGMTITVTSAADTPDATPGDGICADSQGRCTLRAAMTEADRIKGDDVIRFALPGPAPVTIQLGSRLPYITSRAGTMTIDGYSQPGASVNSSAVGSNAVPGVEIRGNGSGAKEVGFYITSMGNTIRGLLIDNIYRGILLDGADAHDNRVIGDWIGFTKTGANQKHKGEYAILLNTGASDNVVGSPDLADRNVVGNFDKAVDLYGPGTDGNVIQDDVFCIRPGGMGGATCATAVDHNFGPSNGVIGGDGPNERVVIGPTTLQGIEYSHGWNPAIQPNHHVRDLTYAISGNVARGNWVGFRGDGSYSAAFRSGYKVAKSDNGNAINVYDGVFDNVIDGNYVASVYDGIQTEAPNSRHNRISGNVIGVSPLGEAAPLTGWGIKVRWGASHDTIVGNVIRHAALGGVGLLTITNTGEPFPPAQHIRISQTIVSDTAGPAIYLGTVAGQPQLGANDLQVAPRITSATTTSVWGIGIKGASVEVYRASRAAGERGLPSVYLGHAVVAGTGHWHLELSGLPAGARVSALQIRSDDTTSELSPNVIVRLAAGGD